MKRLVLALLMTPLACSQDPLVENPDSDEATADPLPEVSDLSELLGPCQIDLGGSTLVVTTTDFATGSVTVVDTRTRIVETDVALGTTDAIPFADGRQLFLVHRFGHDFVDVLEPDSPTWPSRGQYALSTDTPGAPNPHSIAIGSDGLAYVPLFGTGAVRVLDLSQRPGSATVRDIDLSAFADDDGNPEPSLAVACGDIVWVSVQRLDPSFRVVGPDALVAIDVARGTALDLDPDRPGAQGIELDGVWLRQLRSDPTDPTGQTLLGLTTGIERISLAEGAVSWAVAPQVMQRVGVSHHLLPLSFDMSSDGNVAYFASYGPELDTVDCSQDPAECFERASLYRVARGDDSETPQRFATDFDAVDRTLEVIGEELWFGSSRREASGVWVFDVSTPTPTLRDGPLATGLPPYSVTVMEVTQ